MGDFGGGAGVGLGGGGDGGCVGGGGTGGGIDGGADGGTAGAGKPWHARPNCMSMLFTTAKHDDPSALEVTSPHGGAAHADEPQNCKSSTGTRSPDVSYTHSLDAVVYTASM